MAKAKRIRGLKCNSSASAGIRLVLVKRFEEMHDLHEAALDWSDPEGVHSMRVASRRLRSALKDFMPYLRKRGLTSILKQMKNFADALGEVRDQDVAIPALQKIGAQAPAEVGSALKESIETREDLRDKARKELKSILTKGQLKQFKSDFIGGIDKVIVAQEPEQITFLKMSKAIILERLKELEKLSDGLFRPFDVETLHDVRIAAKRLRYALELFQQCFGHSITTYARRVARLQSALGDVHDCDVWIESFGKHVSDARKKKQNDQVAAFVWLLNHFVRLRTKHLRQAFGRWREWEAQDVSEKLRKALNSERRVARPSARTTG
jgi:CHAD domain-containing protein